MLNGDALTLRAMGLSPVFRAMQSSVMATSHTGVARARGSQRGRAGPASAAARPDSARHSSGRFPRARRRRHPHRAAPGTRVPWSSEQRIEHVRVDAACSGSFGWRPPPGGIRGTPSISGWAANVLALAAEPIPRVLRCERALAAPARSPEVSVAASGPRRHRPSSGRPARGSGRRAPLPAGPRRHPIAARLRTTRRRHGFHLDLVDAGPEQVAAPPTKPAATASSRPSPSCAPISRHPGRDEVRSSPATLRADAPGARRAAEHGLTRPCRPAEPLRQSACPTHGLTPGPGRDAGQRTRRAGPAGSSGTSSRPCSGGSPRLLERRHPQVSAERQRTSSRPGMTGASERQLGDGLLLAWLLLRRRRRPPAPAPRGDEIKMETMGRLRVGAEPQPRSGGRRGPLAKGPVALTLEPPTRRSRCASPEGGHRDLGDRGRAASARSQRRTVESAPPPGPVHRGPARDRRCRRECRGLRPPSRRSRSSGVHAYVFDPLFPNSRAGRCTGAGSMRVAPASRAWKTSRAMPRAIRPRGGDAGPARPALAHAARGRLGAVAITDDCMARNTGDKPIALKVSASPFSMSLPLSPGRARAEHVHSCVSRTSHLRTRRATSGRETPVPLRRSRTHKMIAGVLRGSRSGSAGIPPSSASCTWWCPSCRSVPRDPGLPRCSGSSCEAPKSELLGQDDPVASVSPDRGRHAAVGPPGSARLKASVSG